MSTLKRLRVTPVATALVLVALVVAPVAGASVYVVVVLTNILAFALLAMSMSLVAGHAGLLSLAHAAYAGVAGYAVVIFSREVSHDGLLQLLVGIGAGATIAAVTGWIVVRAHGTFFLMLSLAIGELLHILAVQWRAITHGSDGLSAGAPFTVLGSGPVILSGYVYWVALMVFVLLGAMLLVIIRSPFGAALRGIRDNEPRMRSLGYPTSQYKYAIWVLSGGIAGAAGWITVAQLPRFIAPDQLGFHLAGLLLLAVVIGGVESMWGACVAAGAVVLMTTVVSQDLNGRGPLVLGLLFVIAVYALPRGIAGIRWGRGGDRGDRGVPPSRGEANLESKREGATA